MSLRIMFGALIVLAVVNLVLVLPARIPDLQPDRDHVAHSRQQDVETTRPYPHAGGTQD